MAFSLTYLDRLNIEDKKAGLRDPSGLEIAKDGDGFWTVSDNTKKVFRLNRKGKIIKDQSFKLPKDELEGVALDPSGETLLLVREKNNEVIRFDLASRKIVAERRLADMCGYDQVAYHFENSPKNKGHEGITCHPENGAIFVVKEGKPGILIEISPDLSTIISHIVLGEHNGFRDPLIKERKLDFSGLCYDMTDSAFWIISDQASRVFLFDHKADRVLHSEKLQYTKGSGTRRLKKAEGVAYDRHTDILYVVCESDATIYAYAVRRS